MAKITMKTGQACTCSQLPASFTEIDVSELFEAKRRIDEQYLDSCADKMREQGFDPDAGCRLLIPANLYDKVIADLGPYCLPHYMQRSELATVYIMLDPGGVGEYPRWTTFPGF